MIPKVRLDVSQQNFVYRSSEIWNSLIKHVFSICNVEESCIIIPGSTANSDLSASVAEAHIRCGKKIEIMRYRTRL